MHTHTITITRLADDTSDDAEYTIGGDCEGDPTVYTECKRDECVGERPNYYAQDVTRHGEDHIAWEERWCSASDECPLRYVHGLSTAIDEFGRLGTFPLEIEWDEEWTAHPYDDGANDDA